MKYKGFTLVEILVVLFIAVIAASLIVSAYLGFRQRADLITSTQNVLNTLRLAQSKTLASEGASQYGVRLETNKYTLFQFGGPDIQIFALPARVTISGLTDIVFEKITGKPLQTGVITITESSSSQTKSIIIESSGQMGIATGAVLAPTNAREVDSRHVHFTYSTDVRNAVTLRLDFSGTIYDINFQTYLNAAKDKFDWSDQVLRIHTHSLTAVASQFSISRDRRYNTAALSISLDGNNLINYDSNGNTTKGTSALVSEPEWQ